MPRRRTAILVVTGMFFAALLLSLLTHSTGVVRNDPARNIWIPAELTMPLQLQTRTPIGSDPDGLAEDRLSMMRDDGSVPEFQRYGGYITVGANMRDFTGSGAAAAHRLIPAIRLRRDTVLQQLGCRQRAAALNVRSGARRRACTALGGRPGCARMPSNTTTCLKMPRCHSTRITSGARVTSYQARYCGKRKILAPRFGCTDRVAGPMATGT